MTSPVSTAARAVAIVSSAAGLVGALVGWDAAQVFAIGSITFAIVANDLPGVNRLRPVEYRAKVDQPITH